MNIDAIENGYVIDHIPAGKGMQVYEILNLSSLSCQVAIITNAKSKKDEAKDIIKINNLIDLDMDVIAYIDVIKCPNPRCICNNESISHIFKLTDEKGTYRCLYCETKAK